MTAIGVLHALYRTTNAVPHEISVVGFDDISWAKVVSPRLTTIAQPLVAIGTRAVELLQERMAGARIPSRATVFDVTLVERDSVKNI